MSALVTTTCAVCGAVRHDASGGALDLEIEGWQRVRRGWACRQRCVREAGAREQGEKDRQRAVWRPGR